MVKDAHAPDHNVVLKRAATPAALALALTAAVIPAPTHADRQATTQTGACALLANEDIQALAPEQSIAAGVATALEPMGLDSCRYTWGEGAYRYKLEVTVHDASRMFAGMAPNLITQHVKTSVTEGSTDAVIADIGDAAVFKAESPVYVRATAYAKNRVIQVLLDGFDAFEKKDHLIALLKSAASKL